MANEKRLIDADALLDYFRNEHHESEVTEAVKDAPTIDAVHVVRCKDCVSYGGTGWCCEHDTCMEENDFCSYGERKDNDG